MVEPTGLKLKPLPKSLAYIAGTPGAYGVVTMPFSVREGINIFLAGFIPTENLRFRTVELTFKISETPEDLVGGEQMLDHKYPTMTKTLIEKKTGSKFRLQVNEGSFRFRV